MQLIPQMAEHQIRTECTVTTGIYKNVNGKKIIERVIQRIVLDMDNLWPGMSMPGIL
ncbi:MAG: hypothetical protein ABIN94_01135 [Ferruginibacter sp.]